MILNRGTDLHAEAFAELEDALRLMALRPVILNAHTVPVEKLPPGIIYNLENVPLQVDMKRYRGVGREIWDFSEENIRDYPANVPVRHVPIGYHPTMTRFEMRPPQERDIDVLYYGAMSHRRSVVYKQLRRQGLRVERCEHYGLERDKMIARSKCVAVISYLAPYVFPVLRAAHLVANKVPIVAEEGIEVPWWIWRTYQYEDLAEAIEVAVRDGDVYTEARFQAFCSNPMLLPLS